MLDGTGNELGLDMVSYMLGKRSGGKNVTLDSDTLVFTDDGEGNITITEESTNG